MAKEVFSDALHLSKANIARLVTINEIIEEYRLQGYKLTLRQLYYQLVSRDIIPNKVEEYAKLSSLLVKGRMAGVVDWDAIEDRIRVPKLPYWAIDVPDAINDMIGSYRLDRMRDQDVYIEVWVEKDALSGVLARITNKYHVRLMVNRGYSSATAMHDASVRINRATDAGKQAHILYLGDHDPSGMDMVRDITERLSEFNSDVVVKHIALTDLQIRTYNPPPNPAKVSDPRAKEYIAEYGATSWEVDALKPEVLNNLLNSNIAMLIDVDKYKAILEQEQRDVTLMKKFQKMSAEEMDE
jgi:hypothetical protein